MTGEPERIEELTAWLEADDTKSRATRVRRLRDLLDTMPVPSDGLSFLGGEASQICFDEVRRCYMDGSYMAVVLLSLAYVERELAAVLYAAGWEAAKKAPLGAVLEKGHQDGVLSEIEWRTYRELARLRNSHAHFRRLGSSESMMARVVEEDAFPKGGTREGCETRPPRDGEDRTPPIRHASDAGTTKRLDGSPLASTVPQEAWCSTRSSGRVSIPRSDRRRRPTPTVRRVCSRPKRSFRTGS